ncbi:MAG TPA: response regulator transcription factor [Gaiellaceae bacterium]|jgi:two-component system nitrate/nitrite response regulator NarL
MLGETLPPPAHAAPPSATRPIRILVVDDQPLFVEGVSIVLACEAGLEVVATAGDGREGVELATALHPDVVLMDLSMPVMDGFEATRRVREMCPGAAVVVLSGSDSPTDVERAYFEGASAYCTKDRMTELVECIHAAAGRDRTPSA